MKKAVKPKQSKNGLGEINVEQIKQRSRWYRGPYVWIVLTAVLMLCYHCRVVLDHGDDVTIASILNGTDMVSYLVHRYQTWSSRMLMEVMIYGVGGLMPKSWRILDPLVFTLLVYSLFRLLPVGNPRTRSFLVCCLTFMYPFLNMSTAGWIATSMSYLWPLAFGFFSMIPIKKMICGEKIRWYEIPLYLIATLIACATEQGSAVEFGTFFVMGIYLIYKKQFRYRTLLIAQWAISVIGLIVVVTCPGNKVRSIQETARWFPAYGSYSMVHKLELGFSSSLYRFILEPNLIFLAFSAFLAAAVFLRKKSAVLCVLSCVPFGVNLICGFGRPLLANLAPNLAQALGEMQMYGSTGKYDNIGDHRALLVIVLLDALMALVCLIILISLWNAFSSREHALLGIFLVLMGFAASMSMSFSPTIYASVDRPHIYFYFAFVCSAVLLYGECSKAADPVLKARLRSPVLAAMALMGAVSFMNLLFTVQFYSI